MAGQKKTLDSDLEDDDDLSWATPPKPRATLATTPIPLNDGTPNGVTEAEAATETATELEPLAVTEAEPHGITRDMFDNWPPLQILAGEVEKQSPIDNHTKQPAVEDAEEEADGGGAAVTMALEAVEPDGVGVKEDDKTGKAAADLQQKKDAEERRRLAEAAEAEKHTWDCDHENPDAYDPLQKEYFVESGEYGGHPCAKCNLPMVGAKKQMSIHEDAQLIKSVLPAYVCKGKNRRDSDCEHIICPKCYRNMNMAAVEGLEQGVGARKRSRRCTSSAAN